MNSWKWFVLLLASLAIGGVVGAEEASKSVSVKGFVEYVYEDLDRPVGGRITLDNGSVYYIVWDQKGQDMVNDLYDEYAEVRGILSEKESESWLKVESYQRPRRLSEEPLELLDEVQDF